MFKSLAWIAVTAGVAGAAPPTVDSHLCTRKDDRFDQKDRWYLSVDRVAPVANITVADDGMSATVCTDAAKTKCNNIKLKDAAYAAAVNADGTLLAVGSEKGLLVIDAKTGKTKTTIANKRGKDYACGGGLFLGDVVLAHGADCHEFDALPFFANAKTGKYIGPLGDDKLATNGETLIDAVEVDGKLWAISVFDHYIDTDFGTVYLVDVTTGKTTATVVGGKAGATVTEGKKTRKLDADAIAKCP